MSNDIEIDNYIANVLEELKMYINLDYQNLYEQFKNNDLKTIFSTLHNIFTSNYSAMNGRLPTENEISYFWADNSRVLLKANRIVNELKNKLKRTPFLFNIDNYYERIIEKTATFLEESGGSTIPIGMEKINIYYKIPIFIPADYKEIKQNDSLNRYKLNFIGEGSYAKVYKYDDDTYKTFFCLKRAKDDLTPKEIERFKLEYEIMSKLKSPYIVKVYCYDDSNNEYIMECLDCTLDEYIKINNNGKMPINIRKNIVKQILHAFKYIHSKNILHRDISPQNILMKLYDDVFVVKVADFGLVKIPNSSLTSINTEFKGSFNDPALVSEGFNNYEMPHEIYALTQLLCYVMTGKRNMAKIKDEKIKKLMNKGMAPNKTMRFRTIVEIEDFFNEIKL